MSIPGLLNTSYRCLNCGISLKKSEQEDHLEQYPTHEIYKSKVEKSWEEVSPLEINQQLRREIEKEYLRLNRLSKAIKELKICLGGLHGQ